MREPDGSLILRGSMGIGDVEELLNRSVRRKVGWSRSPRSQDCWSHVLGKVPAPGDAIDLEDHRFEVLEANQRKVLRLQCSVKPQLQLPRRRQLVRLKLLSEKYLALNLELKY